MEAPKNETIWVVYIIDDKPGYVITSTRSREVYFLYKVEDEKLIKTKHKAENPMDLEKYVK